jgi:hypothetical protein
MVCSTQLGNIGSYLAGLSACTFANFECTIKIDIFFGFLLLVLCRFVESRCSQMCRFVEIRYSQMYRFVESRYSQMYRFVECLHTQLCSLSSCPSLSCHESLTCPTRNRLK